jgi:hypothetical protein
MLTVLLYILAIAAITPTVLALLLIAVALWSSRTGAYALQASSIEMDGHEVARTVLPHMPDALRRHGV